MLFSQTTRQHNSASVDFDPGFTATDSDSRQLQEESQSEVLYRLDPNITSLLVVAGQHDSTNFLDKESQQVKNSTMSLSESLQDPSTAPAVALSTGDNVTSVGVNATSGGFDTPEVNSTEQSAPIYSYTAMGEIALHFSLLYPEILVPGYIEKVSDILREWLCLDNSVELADPVEFDDLEMSSHMDYNFVCHAYDEMLESQSNNTNLLESSQQDYGAIVGSSPVNVLQSREHVDPFTFYLWQVRYSVWDIGPEFWSFVPEQATLEQTQTIIRQDSGFENVFIRSAVTNINEALQVSLDKSIALGIMDDKLQSTIPGFYASVVGKEAMTFSRLIFPVNEGSSQTYARFEPESNFLQYFGIGLFLVHSTAMVIISVLGRRRKRISEQEVNAESNENHNGGKGCLNSQEVSNDGIIAGSVATV